MEECYFCLINTPLWVFSRFLNCTNGTKSRNDLILSSNIKLVTNVKSIAGAFNDYFVHVGSSLSKQTPETNSLFTNFSNV